MGRYEVVGRLREPHDVGCEEDRDDRHRHDDRVDEWVDDLEVDTQHGDDEGELTDLREAEARLTAMGFRLNPRKMVDGEKDWVYGILCHGRHVSNGDRISIDHPLTLLVGQGTIEDLDDVDMVGAEEVDGGETDDFQEVTGE